MTPKFFINSNLTVKKLEKNGTLKIAGYANTTTKDRGNDIILSNAWEKGISSYVKNPILLYQHKMDQPIGKVDKIAVDSKGLYVEASISDVAEKNYGIKSLIKDGVLKTFSVGFLIKDQDYDRKTETSMIKAVELLEISIVSVPANTDSIFSIKKSFSNTNEYEAFVKSFGAELDNSKIANLYDGSILTEEKQVVLLDDVSQEELEEEIEASLDAFEEPEDDVPSPFINLLSTDTSKITNNRAVKLDGKRFKTIKIATANSPIFQFLEIDLNGESLDNSITVEAEKLVVVNYWEIDSHYDLQLTEMKVSSEESIFKDYETLINSSEVELYKVKNSEELKNDPTLQIRLNKLLNLKTMPTEDWSKTDLQYAQYLVTLVKELKTVEASDNNKFVEFALKLHGHKGENPIKENTNMSTQHVSEVVTIDTKAGTEEKASTASAPAETTVSTGPTTPAAYSSVSAPRVEDLVNKTGEAIAREAAAIDAGRSAREESEAVLELKAQMGKMRDQIASLTTNKMVYGESVRKEQFTPMEYANAVLLAAATRKGIFETKLGQRMQKAVTSVDAFLSNFSTAVYEEMQQQLVIVPMFNRLSVDAKNFRIPVADEDTNGDVAQFQSGTYATGIADTTRVPVTRQNSISAVTLTPHKFMATTHLAKDEEEDTILPLLDFLRQSATRRMARAIDKALLRGDGSLTGFNASPTNAITAGSGYACVFKGVTTLANDISGLRVQTGGNSTKATPTNIASARALLGKYGLQLGNQLVFLTTIEGYNSLVTTTDFRTVDKFGPNATYLTGSLGAIYGIPVIITEFLDVVGAANNQIGLLVYKPGFLVAERRAMEVESEYEPRQQVTAIYMSTRFDFKALTTNSDAALDATRYSMASLIRSGA